MSKVALWQSIQESLSAHLIREWLMKKILMIASNRDIYSTAWDANTTDLQKLCQLCLIYEIDAMPLIEVMSENDEQNCQKACHYFISGFTKGKIK